MPLSLSHLAEDIFAQMKSTCMRNEAEAHWVSFDEAKLFLQD